MRKRSDIHTANARLRTHVVLLLFAVLGGSAATAAPLESLVMPGPVIEGHSEVEADCASCHAPFDKDDQVELCLACHEDVQTDLSTDRGLHGRHPDIAGAQCSTCHADHLGREADITSLVPEEFDHSLTDFELTGAHTLQSCGVCHQTRDSEAQGNGAQDPAQDQAPERFRDAPTNCIDCHQADDRHDGGLGTQCESCHVAERWSEATFEHDVETDFALTGGHEQQPCTACHIDQQYEETAAACAGCHTADDVHQGSRGDSCSDCHTTSAWTDSTFEHFATTGFLLEGAHEDLECAACHLTGMSLAQPANECADCHSSNDVHDGKRGADCQACHNTNAWAIEFEHEAESGFALLGAHAELHCEQCHQGALTDPLPTVCEECHQRSDPHDATLGACGSCHNSAGWTDRVRFDHEFTRFPLLGLHRLTTCEQCHLTLTYEAAESECDACHAGDDPHQGNFDDQCEACHNPGGWDLWQFDHDRQTDFALTGSHENLVCEACHGAGPAHAASGRCSTCHLNDDIHGGQFGGRCERCHTTESFADSVRFR